MKKLFYLLFLLPLAFFASCSDDDDLPQVDLTLTLSGVTQYDNVFYAVKGGVPGINGESDEDTPETVVDGSVITVVDMTAKAINGKDAAVANAIFYLDGYTILPNIEPPHRIEFSTAGLEPGTHSLSVIANVLEVDKSIASASLTYPLKVVESVDELPDGAPEIGTYSITARMDSKK